MRKLHNNDGFSLLEVIISIAALLSVSVFILQMFMVSSNVNNRARDVDNAVAEAITAIETFKNQTGLESYTQSLENGMVSEYNGIVSIDFYYDKNWDPITPSQTYGSSIPANAKYHQRLTITADTPPPGGTEPTGGSLYTVEADVSDISADESRMLVTFRTKKYFSGSYEQREGM